MVIKLCENILEFIFMARNLALVFIILLSKPAIALEVSSGKGLEIDIPKVSELFRKARLYWCSNEKDKYERLVFKLAQEYPQFYESSSQKVFLDPEAVPKILSKTPVIQSMSESERLTYASALFTSRSEKLDLVSDLLDFKSENPSYESFRLDLEHYLHALNGINDDSLYLKSIEIAPILSVSLVAKAFRLGPNLSASNSLLISSIFKRKLSESVDPDLTVDVVDYLAAAAIGKRDLGEAEIEKAYRRCSRDETIADMYAMNLVWARKYKDSHGILLGLVNAKYPIAEAEFGFGLSNYGLKDFPTAKVYLSKVVDTHNLYVSQWEKKEAGRLLSKLDSDTASSSIWYFVLSFCALILGALTYELVFKQRQT